jgi:hypothetical protein
MRELEADLQCCESDSDDHLSEAAHTPPSSDEYTLPSHRKFLKINDAGRQTLGQIVQEANLCIVSLRAFDRDDPAFDQLTERLHFLKDEYQKAQKIDQGNDLGGYVGKSIEEDFEDDYLHYNEHYDEIPEAGNNIQRSMRPSGRIGSKNVLFISTVLSLKDAEQRVGKKWNTVKVKNGNKKSHPAYADRSNLQVEDQNTHFRSSAPWLRASAVKKAEDQDSPKLKTFNEVHRRFHEQHEPDELPSYENKFQHQDHHEPHPGPSWYNSAVQQPEVTSSSPQPEYSNCSNGWKNCGTCAACTGGDVTVLPSANSAADRMSLEAHRGTSTVKVYHVDSPHFKDGITIFDLPTRSDISNVKVHTGSPVVKDGVSTAHIPTRRQDQSAKTEVEDKKQVAAASDRIREGDYAVCEGYGDSGSEIVPIIPKSGHRTKSSDFKTATGSAPSRNPAAPNDFMVDEFLEVADYKFYPR